MSLKILLTVHQFFPEYFAGTEVLTLSVAKNLLRRGHEVCVYTGYPTKETLPDWKRFDAYEIEGIPVRRFHHCFVPMGDQQVLSELEYDNHLSAGYFSALIDEIAPDVLHFFHFSRLSSSVVDVARQKQIPAYYTPTDFWAVCPTCQLLLGDGQICPGPSRHAGNCIKHVAALTRWKNRAGLVEHLPTLAADAIAWLAKSPVPGRLPFRDDIAVLSRRMPVNIMRLNALNGIISPTRLMTEVLTRNGVDARLIRQSAYGIDIAGFDGATPREYDGRRPLALAYIGTLAQHKGCHVLIEAFRQLSAERIKLRIYGNLNDFPDYASKLQRMSKDCANISFLGTFPNAEIAQVLSEIDALVVPSVWYENAPLVVYSALAAKCPVIVSDFPGMAEVVTHGVNGLTFAPRDAGALAQCLKRLCDEAGLLNRLSTNCAPPKSVDAYVDELLALYAQSPAPLHDLPDRPSIAAFQMNEPCGHVTGWVAIRGKAVKSVRIEAASREIAAMHTVPPRPEVNQSLGYHKKKGWEHFSFSLDLNEPVSEQAAILVIEAGNGRLYRFPLAECHIGQVVQFPSDIQIALDHAEFAENA